MRLRQSLAAMLALSLAAAVHAEAPAVSLGQAVCATGETMARVELLFGMSRADGGEISEAEWVSFIDREVTPRFPDGLTVLTGYGQWRNAAGEIRKEISRMLVIWHKLAPDLNDRIEAVRLAFKTTYRQESVMRVDGTSCVSF
jgi:hypothetical protein